MSESDAHLYIALGGNLPNGRLSPLATLHAALADLSVAGLGPLQCSRIYATPCFPKGAGPDYVNAVAAAPIPDALSPQDVLTLLHRIEAAHGRTRETRWGMRTLDLDLIAFGRIILPDPATHARWRSLDPGLQRSETPDRLILPHPRLQDRAFVLVPMLDIAPEWTHPVTGLTVTRMAAALPAADRAEVRPISPDSTLVKAE